MPHSPHYVPRERRATLRLRSRRANEDRGARRDGLVLYPRCGGCVICRSPRRSASVAEPRIERRHAHTHTRTQPSCIHAQFRRDTTLSRSTGALVSQPTDAQYRSSTLWHSWVQAQTRQNPTRTGRQCYPGFSRTARPRGGAATSITISNRVRHSYTTEGAHRWCCGRKRRARAAIVPTTRISPTSPAARMPTLESSH